MREAKAGSRQRQRTAQPGADICLDNARPGGSSKIWRHLHWIATPTRPYPQEVSSVIAPPLPSNDAKPVTLGSKVGAYVALTKPRIIELLLISTVPTMVVAQRGLPSLWLMVATVLGGMFSAGGANAINMYVDRDIDALMDRTKNRPLVTGVIEPRSALIFAISLEVIAFFFLWRFVNLLSAVLAVSACLFYVFVYTLWLKRTSRSNIVIGGAAGAVPVLIGWTSVTNDLSWAPILLFAVMFMWTPPHFWALAIKYKDDYSRADVPMLPSVASPESVARQILLYTVAVVGLSLWFGPIARLGWIYMVSASLCGAGFIYFALKVWQTMTAKSAMRLFTFSITYVTLLFGAMAVDQLVGW